MYRCPIELLLKALQKAVPWVFSEFISSLPLNVLFPTLFAMIMYFMTGMSTDELAQHLFILLANSILVQLGSVGFALLSASLVRSFESASLLANGTSIFLLCVRDLLTGDGRY